MDYGAVGARIARVRDEIAERQRRAGWTHPVRVVAVTKGHGIDAIRAARAAGLEDIGESRVQEALSKQAALPDPAIRWHLIGPLQRNKARHAVGRFTLIHSVDRPELVVELAKRCATDLRQRVLVEVNCSGEPQKHGVAPDGALALVEEIVGEPRLEFLGLMTLAEFSSAESVQRAAFAKLRAVKEALERAGHPVPELSMGMSADYPVAVEEGATMVRLGTVLFGERHP
jgi:pyridoxal phosphate enzyme (YggS family)